MTLGQDDFWGEVLGRAAQRPGPVVDLLGKPKVGDFAIAELIEEQILGLEIAVQDREAVQILED